MKLLRPLSFTSELPPLVYLPGMDGTGKLFYRQMEFLSPFFNLYALSFSPIIAADWWSLTQTAIALLEKEFPQQRVTLCGESFGGCLALTLPIQAPQLVEKLILVNPASSFRRYPWLSWGIPLLHWLPEGLHSSTTLGGLPFLAQIHRLLPEDQRQLLLAMRSLPPSAVSQRLSLLQAFSPTTSELESIVQPTLILASQGDRLLPSVTEARYLQSHLPRAQIHYLPDSGHACLLETDLNLAAILEERCFLPAPLENLPLSTPT